MTPEPQAPRTNLVVAGLLLAVGLLYASGLRYQLVYDDAMLVGASRLQGALGDLPGILSWDLWASTTQAESAASGYYRPLFLLSLWVDRLLPADLWLLSHRVQGLAWHLGVTALLVGMARSRGASLPAACLAAAMFALHPAQVASVQFIAARNDIMAAALVLVALQVARGASAWRRGALVVLTFGAVLSKESALLAPALLGVGALVEPGIGRARRALEAAACGALGVGLALALRTTVGVGYPPGASVSAMLGAVGPALAQWASVLVAPVGLTPGVNMTWPEPVGTGAVAGAVVLLGLVAAGAGRVGLGFLGGAGLLLLPALAGVAGNGLMPDRYLYGPLAMLVVPLSIALDRLPRPAGLGLGLITSLGLWGLSAGTLPVWQSDATLWRAAARAHPQPFTWAAYGKTLEDAGLVDEAAALIEKAATGSPPMPHACFNATRIQLRRGAPAEAARVGTAALDAGCEASPELLAPMAVGQAASGQWAAAERTASWVGADPTGQAVLVRCAAAARRGELGVLTDAARDGGGDPRALQSQVAWLLRSAGEEAVALAVESAPLDGSPLPR